MRRLALTVAFALLCGATSHACEDVGKLLAHHRDLSPLRGQLLEEGIWESTLKIGGFDYCRVEAFEDGLTFNCGVDSFAVDQKDEAFARFDAILDRVWDCSVLESLMLNESRSEDLMMKSASLSGREGSFMMQLMRSPDFRRGRFQDVWAISLTLFED